MFMAVNLFSVLLRFVNMFYDTLRLKLEKIKKIYKYSQYVN